MTSWLKTLHDIAVAQQSARGFILVKHGANEQAIFNPRCQILSLLKCIRNTCHCEPNVHIDLMDTDGNVQQLPSRCFEHADDVIRTKDFYVLIKMEREHDAAPPRYVALLDDVENQYPEIHSKLTALNKPRFAKRDSRWNVLKGTKAPKMGNAAKLMTPKENRRPKSPGSSRRS